MGMNNIRISCENSCIKWKMFTPKIASCNGNKDIKDFSYNFAIRAKYLYKITI